MRIDEVVQDITQTPAFKRWFQGSKVVDPDGNPMVVFHGTNSAFDEFKVTQDLGFHFGSSDIANKRLRSMKIPRKQEYSPSVIPAYLRMIKPIILDHDPNAWATNYIVKLLAPYLGSEAEPLEKEYEERLAAGRAEFNQTLKTVEDWWKKNGKKGLYGGPTKKSAEMYIAKQGRTWDKIWNELNSVMTAKIRAALIKQGYDGIIYPNEYESGGRRRTRISKPENVCYVVFNPQQIKGIFNANPSESPKFMEARKAKPEPVSYTLPPRRVPNPAVTAILQRALQEYDEAETNKNYPRDACDGGCDDFANGAAGLLEEAGIPAEVLDTYWFEEQFGHSVPDYHVFLKVGNVYYDAWEMEGTNNPVMLPFIWRQRRSMNPPWES